MSWSETNKDKLWSIMQRANVEKIWNRIFPGCEYTVLEHNDDISNPNYDLDIRKHIDATISPNCTVMGTACDLKTILSWTTERPITVQEKILRPEHRHYNTITFEFLQNRGTPMIKEGEWFDCQADLYLSGYATQDGSDIECYMVIDFPAFRNYIMEKYTYRQLIDMARPSTSRASFLWFDYREIPEEFIIAKFNVDMSDTKVEQIAEIII